MIVHAVDLVCVTVQACVVDRNPNADGYAHASHGRGEAAFNLVRCVLAVTFALQDVLKGTALVVITCSCAALLVYVCLQFGAFYVPNVNHGNSAAAFAFAWCALCAALMAARQNPKVHPEFS